MDIVSRAQWGARYPDGFGNAPLPAREVWLHHSVTAAPPDDLAAEKLAMRRLEDIGQSRFGGGVSYTWAVMPSGRVFQGHSPNRQGAHTKGRNSIARAIVLVGNYDVAQPTAAQKTAVAELLRFAHGAGWITSARLAGGHRDAPGASTACPGRFAHAAIREINELALRGQFTKPPQPGDGGAGAPPAWFGLPTLAKGSTGESVTHLQAFLRRTFPSYAGSLPVTGNFQDLTRAAVMEFQGRVGIARDGVVGRDTNGHLWRHGYRG